MRSRPFNRSSGAISTNALGQLPVNLTGVALIAFAFVLQYAGLVLERWFFLAQANHPQNLYYQSKA